MPSLKLLWQARRFALSLFHLFAFSQFTRPKSDKENLWKRLSCGAGSDVQSSFNWKTNSKLFSLHLGGKLNHKHSSCCLSYVACRSPIRPRKKFYYFYLLSCLRTRQLKLVVCKKSYPTSPEAMSSIDNDIGNGEQKPFTTTAGARHEEKKLFSCSTRSVRSVFHNFDFPQRWRETFIVWMKMCFPQLLLKLNRFSPPSAHTVYVTTKHNVFIEALKSGAISEAILSFFGWRLLDCFSHNLPAPSAPYHVGEPLKPFWCEITISWCDDKRLDLCNYSWRHDETQRDILKCIDNDIKDFLLDFFSFQIDKTSAHKAGRKSEMIVS